MVRITAKEGEADAVARILEGLVEPSMAEPGMKYFMPYRSADDPSQFFVYELYEDASGWDAHNSSPHFLAAVDALVAKAAHRERIPFRPFVDKTPPVKIAFLHTAQVHVDTFDRIFAQLGSGAKLLHRVAPELLDRARSNGLDSVRHDVAAAIAEMSDADAVMCTCSTLGPLVDELAQSSETLLRIDRPLMEKACLDGPNILVALCLDSTRDATLSLLSECASRLGKSVQPIVVVCSDAWACFEAGDMAAYARSIADAIKAEVSRRPEIDSIVLAQASMRVAEADLINIGIPVRSSPVLAAERALQVAMRKTP